jgi:hypothetical protein
VQVLAVEAYVSLHSIAHGAKRIDDALPEGGMDDHRRNRMKNSGEREQGRSGSIYRIVLDPNDRKVAISTNISGSP